MTANDGDATIVRCTIDLGRNLGLRVVAEGVEDEQSWDGLVALGCDFVQGYYLCRPMAADAVSGWLTAYQREGSVAAS
jgi:EAL domain-containing protein (putative c-di-GMP-specific phosphodiesterase class I)